ncbi:MFS transporter [Mycetocola spongiae]|uniref:MFS transporter n=1 Tax=Mycetocola spongiae TaxID=2859226 RepID=UPI001CF0FBB8|nr:MFS transporter [Mycetocola spongiae]
MSSLSSPSPSLFSREYLWVTLGSCALVFLGAFESMAVTTIMPVVSADLDGAALYALAFAGPLATSVIGMVIAGNWSDRSGPVGPLYTAGVLFVIGLLISGLSTNMYPFIAGRLAQGLGSGAITVALYVVVARALPPVLHPKIFAGFATAWVLPSLVGPVVAGAVAEVWSWHWVFLGVVGLVAASMAMVMPTLRVLAKAPRPATPVPWDLPRAAWAVLAALAVLTLSMAGELRPWGPLISLGALIVALIAVRPLLPRGTLGLRRGLPGVIRMRGIIAAAFFGAEIYIPYLLVTDYDFSPTAAGLAITGSAISWALGSAAQGRFADRISNAAATRFGSWMTLLAILTLGVTALLHLSPVVVIVAWTFAGAGLGTLYPRLSVLTLSHSTEKDQGFNSAALTIADSFGSAISLAIAGVIFTSVIIAGVGPFAPVFAFAALLAVAALALSPRIAERA